MWVRGIEGLWGALWGAPYPLVCELLLYVLGHRGVKPPLAPDRPTLPTPRSQTLVRRMRSAGGCGYDYVEVCACALSFHSLPTMQEGRASVGVERAHAVGRIANALDRPAAPLFVSQPALPTRVLTTTPTTGPTTISITPHFISVLLQRPPPDRRCR